VGYLLFPEVEYPLEVSPHEPGVRQGTQRAERECVADDVAHEHAAVERLEAVG
jgi:hypothetical protein